MTCQWIYDRDYDKYDTKCDNAFFFDEGKIFDNGFIYCPYCGKKIEEVILCELSEK